MAVAAEYQIPHSQFLTWSQLDRDKAIWFHIRQKSTCPGCGTRREEWSEDEGGRDAYLPVIDKCPGCVTTAQKQAEIENSKVKVGHAARVVLVENPAVKRRNVRQR